MKFLIRFLLILGLAYLAQRFLPWWSSAIVAFAVGLLMSQKPKRRLFGKNPPPPRSFLAGFAAIFVLWTVMAWWHDAHNGAQLSTDVLALIAPNLAATDYPGAIMILITALIGGVTGGLSALSGNLLGEAIKA